MRRIALAVVLVALLPLIAEGQDLGAFRRIGPGNILLITVEKNDAMSRLVVVCPDGKISLPLLNDVQAAGLTTTGLEGVLTERLKDFMPSPEVRVWFTPAEKSSKIVVLRPEGRTTKRIPFDYNKVTGEQENNPCANQGDIPLVP